MQAVQAVPVAEAFSFPNAQPEPKPDAKREPFRLTEPERLAEPVTKPTG